MDVFTYLVANKTSAPKVTKVRKVYVNEDPSLEETVPCPTCSERNQHSSVRYLYINLHEAIYKCEAVSCMFPFRNFKFKNYTERTVYYYESVETPPALSDFAPAAAHTNVTFPTEGGDRDVHQGQHSDGGEGLEVEFNLDFFSPERNRTPSKDTSSGESLNVSIFDSPSLSFGSLVQDFDTGFIDDLLQDLGQGSPDKKIVFKSPVRSAVPPAQETAANNNKSNRQLKRCLQMFEECKSSSGGGESIKDGVFKVPPLPGSEGSPPKHKPKKSPQRRHHHHARRGTFSPPKKHRMKPLEFLETLNSIQSPDCSLGDAHQTTSVPGIKRLNQNQKVERMLSFIERSMKNRENHHKKDRTVIVEHPDPSLAATNPKAKQTKKKRPYQSKRMSLSETVLQDSQFDYNSASESEEQEDAPEPVIDHMPNLPEQQPLPPAAAVESKLLPTFEDLMKHIHPTAATAPHQNEFVVRHSATATATTSSSLLTNGFRSAGSSPTRIQQWEQTPPRRIHSMESLCSLLE